MLEGKVALVTGRVARNRPRNRSRAGQARREGDRHLQRAEAGAQKVPAIGKVLNVSDAAQCDALVASIQKEFGEPS